MSSEAAAAGSANVVAGVTVPATGWLCRTEIWHCRQHSREENAGPAECRRDLRQQLALVLFLQQQEAESSEANASAGISCARRKTASALARNRPTRVGIRPSILRDGMSLKEYSSKRSFKKTPEPEPRVQSTPGGNSFCVQRHDATRLHYDFRLEVDGTLKSWAVPKGPSLEPLSKHLAMHVEDHPLDYGGFEGNIPKGEYGGGSVMLWDRGSYELLGDAPALAQIERGDFKFRLHGEKLRGEFALVLMRGRGKGNEWLLIKKKDAEAKPGWNIEDYARSVVTGRTQQEIAENLPPATNNQQPTTNLAALEGAAKVPMPRSVSPMLATIATKPPSGDAWLYEVKWDGVRALCFIDLDQADSQLRIFSRTQKRCEQQYPELSVLPRQVKASQAILDGEIAVLDDQGRSSFSLIQPRISVADANAIAHLSRSTPVHLFLFDLLYLDGYDLRGATLDERKRLLAEIVTPSERIHVSDYFTVDGKAMLEAARGHGLEGIVAKARASKYEGRRSRDWLKIKINSSDDFVIGGFTHGERDYFSSLVLGRYDGEKLVHAGQVGTGFNEKSLKEIFEKLEPLITKQSPFTGKVKALRDVTWVKPELVAEIKYLEITPDGLLRAPVFMALRTDKDPKEAQGDEEYKVDKGPLIPTKSPAEVTLEIEGHRLKLTNLNKVFYPGEGVTKRDVINYYDAVAPLILPHLRDRPLSLKRYPNGINGQYFFQKEAEGKVPEWVRLEPIFSDHNQDKIHYIICNDRATLVYLANLACIDQNPWMSRIGSLDHPDFALIDLDPTEGCPYSQIVEAAQLVKKTLDSVGLAGYPKTTGGDGMHIYIPLEPVYTFEQVRSFAELLSVLVIKHNPDLFTTPRTVSQRKKAKVYFDYLQISSAKTIAAPYVLRAHLGAPVSTPLDWSEVKAGLEPGQFNIHNVLDRFRRTGDLFEAVLTKLQRLEPALEKVGGSSASPAPRRKK
jgi:bifunctional non-homologous end joining protein LigD